MKEATLSQILERREARAARQLELISLYNAPVICFTMNIAGPVKTTPLIERAFKAGLDLLKVSIKDYKIISQEQHFLATGCEALFSVQGNSEILKDLCVSIEESSSLGRLFDIDVISENGIKLERKTPRVCLICNKPGRICARGRVHSATEVFAKTEKIISDFFLNIDSDITAHLAVKSLIDEVYTTPKPGLVDSSNSGSHKDMDINTFIKSANVLRPYFAECFRSGHNFKGTSPCEVFPQLREAGIHAEKEMLCATNGVNTHKGIIYSMGIICAAAGFLWCPERPFATPDEIFSVCSQISKKAVENDFRTISSNTAGARLYLEKGLTGIRGEAASGFPSVLNTGLPSYKTYLQRGFSPNDAGVYTLLRLISKVSDTNLYHRGGDDGVVFAKSSALRLLENDKIPDLNEVVALDKEFIKRNLSPGGCADLLAITYFINSLQSY